MEHALVSVLSELDLPSVACNYLCSGGPARSPFCLDRNSGEKAGLLRADTGDQRPRGGGEVGLRLPHECVLTGEDFGPVSLGGFEPSGGHGVSGECGGIETLLLSEAGSLLVAQVAGR